MSRNLSDALIDVLADVTKRGEVVHARGQDQREVRGYNLTISRPNERVVILPGRRNNIFAQIAETIWVLSGRNDIEFLTRYLPRASEFSDDGSTWRAGYGPRLRRWGSDTDQLAGVVRRFNEDSNTKRAVMSIFDPGSDYIETKDVPCNNWLHFLKRNGELHLSTAVRANDVIWGFSGINVFEWSVLQEIIAASVDARVGDLTWFVGSMHVYERHYAVAERILRNESPLSPYHFGVPSLSISTGTDRLDATLEQIVEVDQAARRASYGTHTADISDPFFAASAQMLQVFNMVLNHEPRGLIMDLIAAMQPSDFRVAAVEYIGRTWALDFIFELPLAAEERAFLSHHSESEQNLQTNSHAQAASFGPVA